VVADQIRGVRKGMGLTQEEVARRSGLTLNGYADIERGVVRDPHVSSLSSIARALDVPLSRLLGEAAPLGEAPQEPGQSGQEWARELGARRHGMSVEEWKDYVRALDSEGLIEESRKLLDETKMLQAAFSADKWQRPEEKDRRAALSRELRELRAYRYAELAVAAKKIEDDEAFWKVVQAMAQDRDDVAAV
jgi:transcriptional regulator with XRE-family HTH domain